MRTILLCFFTIFIIESYAYDKYEKVFLLKKFRSDQFGPKLVNRVSVGPKLDINTKKANGPNNYTVFSDHIVRATLLPGNSFFKQEVAPEAPKIRVKKVLPEFWTLSRKKRSVPTNATLATNTKKAEDVKKEVSNAQTSNSQKDGKAVKKAGTANAPVPSKRRGKNVARNVQKNQKKAPKNKNTRANAPRKGKQVKRAKAKPRAPKRSQNRQPGNKNAKKQVKRAKGAKVGGRRLIAARQAMIESYPYVVSIQKDGEHWCSGALLNQRLVITTANCMWKATRQTRMKIRACSSNVDSGGQVVRVAEVMKHPRWSIRKKPDFDLALLLTDEHIRFSHSCHAVDLPNRVMMPAFDDAWVASWGTERRDGMYVNRQPSTLQVYHAQLLDKKDCNNITVRFGIVVTENFICMEQSGRRAPCTRDTGAPAVSDGVLWGLASWGIRKLCGTERFPAMYSYTASAKNMDFIMNATHLLMSEHRLNPFLDRYNPSMIPQDEGRRDVSKIKIGN